MIFYILLLAWPILQFAVFYIGVNFNSILLAFKEYESKDVFSWVGFKNFELLFSDFKELTVFSKSLKNSLTLFLVGMCCGSVLGLLFSFYVYKKLPAHGFFKVILFLPSIIPSIALVVMFKQITSNAVPTVMESLFGIEMKALLANPDTVFGTILFYNVWVGFGTSILLYVGAMGNISESVVEAAHLDGAGYVHEFCYITMPSIWKTLATFIIVAVGGIFVNSACIYAFFGATAEEGTSTIGYWLYKETVKIGAYASYPKLSAFGILLTAVTAPLVYAVKFLTERFGPSTE